MADEGFEGNTVKREKCVPHFWIVPQFELLSGQKSDFAPATVARQELLSMED